MAAQKHQPAACGTGRSIARHPDTRGSTGNANRQLTRDAIIATDPYIDYANYDTNSGGYIASDELHITVIAAGYETSYGGTAYARTPSLWGHRWSLGFYWRGTLVAAPTVDGKIVAHYTAGRYTQSGEWHCSRSDTPRHVVTIGIMVHEVGHDLDWPDLYDTDASSCSVGRWSVMESGMWLATTGHAGSKPSHPDAWCKWYQGWVTPYRVTTPEISVVVQQVETNQRVIQLLDHPSEVEVGGTGEYFLVENRQKTGYDSGLSSCGLLILHNDETRTSNSNDSSRLVDLEEADGFRDLDFWNNSGDAHLHSADRQSQLGTDEALVILHTVYSAGYSTARAHSGSRSMRLGIETGPNLYGYSSAQQAVTIPSGVTEAQLSFYYYPVTAPGDDDRIYFCVLRAADDSEIKGDFWTEYTPGWHLGTFNLLEYAGPDIKVHFGVRNDGTDEVTTVYLDDVQLHVG